MPDDFNPDASELLKRIAEIKGTIAEYVQKVRAITDTDIQRTMVAMGKVKVQVAKLIKEQRDLQEKILWNTKALAESQEQLADAKRAGEDESEHAASIDRLAKMERLMKPELESLRRDSAKVIDEARFAEIAFDRAKRARLLVDTWDSVRELQAATVKFNLAIESISPEERAIAVERRRHELLRLEADLKELQQLADTKESPDPM